MKIWIEIKYERTILLTLVNVLVTRKYGTGTFLKRMQVARIKIKVGNSKLNKYIPVRVKAPSFVIKSCWLTQKHW